MARQKNITARSLLEDQQNSAAQLLTDSGLDAWTNRKYELKQSQQDFSNYISSGNYSSENNAKYRDMANQAINDLTEEQKKYKKNSDQYNTIGDYLSYYENQVPNFDRMDVTANARDYLSYDTENNKFNNWHSEEDYANQRAYLDEKRNALQAEMDALGETESDDYKVLKAWQEQYDMLSEALEERNKYDRQFEDINDYTAYERSSDYKNSMQAKQTLKNEQAKLEDLDAQIKPLEMRFAGYSDMSALGDEDLAAYNELLQLQQERAQTQKNVLAATSEVAGLEKWQKDAAISNYYQEYGLDADYETILNDLIQARDKAEEGSEDWAKIDLQIRALAGENEDGRDANGLYDTSTLYGRSVMRNFDTEAAQKRLEEIDAELTELGVPLSRAGAQFANTGVTGQFSMSQGEPTKEEDPRVMELRREKLDLTRKLNTAENFQGRYDAESKFASLSDEEKAKLIEEGKKHIGEDAQVYYHNDYDAANPNGTSTRLKNFEYLDDEVGGDIRDLMLAAIGAEALGEDIGFTIDEALGLYEEDLAQIAGMKRAQKISDMDSDFARWNTQVLGVGTLSGLNQFWTGTKQFFTDDYIAPNATSYLGQYTRKDLERYGDERIFGDSAQGGSNVSQLLFDTTQTTANMLPMIALSYLTSGVAGAAGASTALAGTIGQVAGATAMGMSSAGNTYQQAIAEGWDKTDAKTFACITGAAEGAMQYLIGGISGLGGVGEEQLLKYATGINNAALRFATETGVHILSETTEELAQNRLERYLRWQFNDEDSDWYSWTDDDWYTVVVTALSTGAMEAPGVAKSTFGAQRLGEQLSGQRAIPAKQEKGNKAVISEIGKAMQSDKALADTLTIIGTNMMEEGTAAYELAERMESGKAPKNAMNLGNLYREIVNEYVSRNGKNGYEDAMTAVIGGAVKYHALNSANDAVNQAKQVAEETRKNNPGAEVLDANASALRNAGVPLSSLNEYSAITNKVLSGTELSDSEAEKLGGNSLAAKATRSYLGSQLGELSANTTPEETKAIVHAMAQEMKVEKQRQKNEQKMSVLQAAMEAVDKIAVNRAAANADIGSAKWASESPAWGTGSVIDKATDKGQSYNGWKPGYREAQQKAVKASTVKAVQKADANVEAAQARLDQIQRMSFKELGTSRLIENADQTKVGLTESRIAEGSLSELQKQMQELNKRAEPLESKRFPTKEERSQLATIREQQAAVKAQMTNVARYEAEQIKAQAPTAKAATAQAQAAPAQNSSDSVPDIITIPGRGETSRAQFVKDFMTNNPGATEAQANARFNQFAEQTGAIKKGNVQNGQTASENQERNAVAERRDGSQNSLRGEQTSGQYRADELEDLRTERGKDDAEPAVRVTKDASKVTDDHVDVLADEFKDLPELNANLKRAGFSKITYIADGDLVNAIGQSVEAVYRDGELFLKVAPGADYVGTAEHEKLHLRLDLMRAKFGEDQARAFVASTLQNLLGEEAFVKAFDAYAEVYGPAYRGVGSVDTIAHMICEEMLCDMIGGVNNFEQSLGDYLEDAESILEASGFNVSMQNLVDNPSEDPGQIEMDEIDKNALPYGIPADTLLDSQNVDNPSTQPADASSVSKFAFFGLAEALGFKVDQTGSKNKVYYLNDEDARLGQNGFTQVTVDMIKQSPIGDLIRYSVDKGDITADQAEQQYNLFASIASITDQTHDFYQAMQFMGSTIFTALKANSDAQYGTTYDFPSICTKTQAIINEMSAQMVARGRSLTESEIRQAYNDVFNDGNPVPCPECYVFSRWVGIGGLLDNIRSYQERFGKMSVDEVIAAYNEANKEVLAFAKENGLSKGRAKGSLASLLDKQYKSLEEDIQKRENQGEAVPNKDYEIRDKLAARMSTIRSLTWIDEVYFAGKEHKAGNVNPNFSVPINVLYDLNEGETFARDYKEAWAFRTTQGAGYGKAITPYAEAILGEGMLVTANTTKSIKAKAAGALNNPYQTERGRITDSSARGKNLKTARKKELNQLFIGGQRLQSTSDARFDNAVDYLLAALELQSMKGGAQVYTKVPGAVAFFDICKMCTNMSMMPKGGGLDASGNPVDTSVGGMDLKTMVMLRKRFEHAGSITIGVNDAHIRALMAQEFRDFIIPYHASGGKIDLIEYFRQVQDPDLKNQKDSEGNPIKIRSSDYTKTQSDKILSDELLRSYFGKTEPEIEDIHKFRDTRLWILTAGKSGTYYSDVLDPYAEGLTESQSNARAVLQELYASMQADGKWNGVQLAKGKVEHQIFPNEFWDTKSTYDTSSVNTQRYLDYCDALGFLHRFSGKTISKGQIIPVTGYDQNGNKVELTDLAYDKDGNIEPFFWKTLTDRRMYGNNGQYLEQPNVDLTNLKAETVATFAEPMGERRYNHRVSMVRSGERAAVSRMSNQTEAVENAVSRENSELRSDSEISRETETGIPGNVGRGVPEGTRETNSAETRGELSEDQRKALTEKAVPFLDEDLTEEGWEVRALFSTDEEFLDHLYQQAYKANDPAGVVFEGIAGYYVKHPTELFNIFNDVLQPQASVSRNSIQSQETELAKDPVEEATEGGTITRYSIRQGPPPQKTQWGFKLMRVDADGKPHAMFIDAARPYELGVWYNADAPALNELIQLEPGYAYLVDENNNVDVNSRKKISRSPSGTITGLPGKTLINQATDEGKRWMTVTVDKAGKKAVANVGLSGGKNQSPATFAMRPGLHAVDIPSMAHIGPEYKDVDGTTKKKRHPDERWFLIEYPVDQDYNQEAYNNPRKDIRDHLPTDGWYSFQTNSGAEARQHWFITGGMKIVGAVSEEDVRKFTKEKGFEQDLEWLDGKNYDDSKGAIDLFDYIQNTDAAPTPSKDEMRQKIEAERGETVWSVKVTPEMKESVLKTGQPLFSVQDNSTNDNPYPADTLQHDLYEHAIQGDLAEWLTQQANEHEDALENAKIRPPVIPSKGFVPRISEQRKEALETRRKGLIQAKGAMKPSEKNSNGMVLPKEDERGNKFHRFLQNVITAKQTTPAHDQIENFVFTDVASTYTPDSNERDLNWAKEVIHEDGIEQAVRSFNRAATAMDNSRHDITKNLALGQQLLIETSRQGDMQKFLDVLSSLTLLSSQAGKSLQAFRMLKQSGPIGELYYVQKSVKQLNDKFADKIEAGKMPAVTVDENLANDVLMAADEKAQDEAMDKLIASIAAQVPVTLADKWNAWRYLAMLGNARTHIRNIIGNAVFVPLRFAKDLMSAGGEFIATKAGWMEEQDRRKAVTVSRELRDFAKQDALVMQKELQGTGKYNPMREILDARKVLPGFLETLSRGNGDLLELEDWFFLSPAYQKALGQALSHTGFTAEQLSNTVEGQKALNNARRIAVEEAQKATYRDFNAAASMLNRIKRMETGKASDKVLGVLLEGILPFTKTPINILRRGVEYSPIGIASSILEAANGVKNGNLDVAQFIDHLSAGLSGTAVAVLGYLLASLGFIRNKKDDKEEEFEKLQGYQDYSVQVGNVSATIDWAAPTALPLFTGAAIHSLTQGDDIELKDAWDAMMMIAEPMMSLSMLDGLNNVLSSASYADDSQKLATVASSAFTSYLGQAFPTLGGQVARSIDGTRRSTYIDKNSPVPSAIQRFVQSSVQNKFPVWEAQKIPYIDQWGREDTVNSKALGALENFLSPSYINIVHTTDVDEELTNLYNATKDSGVLPSTVSKYFSVNGERKDLTADEYVSYARDVGSTKYQLLTELFSDPRYQKLNDAQKAKAIDYIYKYSTAAGKYHIDQNYDLHGQGKWMEEANAAKSDFERFEIIWKHISDQLNK